MLPSRLSEEEHSGMPRRPSKQARRSSPNALRPLFCLLVLAWIPSRAALDADHSPKEPKSAEPVVITVRSTFGSPTQNLTLEYQVVEPGRYVALEDPALVKGWNSILLSSAGTSKEDGKSLSARIPADVQKHRRLVRYRVRSQSDDSIVAPAPGDAQPNFAYFVYDGIPAWRAAINPGRPAQEKKMVTYTPETMRSVQPYHLIASQEAVENVTWKQRKRDSGYDYTGTFVANGKVYDHVRFRARGGNWRYAMGKNMWKIDFLKGHHFQARDNWGREYRTKWGKLNLGACIQQGDYGMRGEQGMFEAIAYRLFNLAGVEAPHTHWVHLRIIDEEVETPADQYQGDFWGLYLSLENPDEDFLKEHRLPLGNLYKMDFGGPDPEHLADGAPADRSDVIRFMNELRQRPDDAWWRANVDLPRYYSYRAILECIHHYDIAMGKNYYYLKDPATNRWQVVPWDVDLTWSNEMFGNGAEPFFRAGLLQREPFKTEYENRLTEIRDLLFNPEQTGALIDQYAAMIAAKSGPSFVDADRAKWDFHPIMSSQYILPEKTRPGLFYKGFTPQDFGGAIKHMKAYVAQRGAWVDKALLADAVRPPTPKIEPARKLDFAAANLRFALHGKNAPARVRWRVAEISETTEPIKPIRSPRRYEIETVWESEGGSVVAIPTNCFIAGQTYRVRARIQPEQGYASHWSEPVQFTVPAKAPGAIRTEDLPPLLPR